MNPHDISPGDAITGDFDLVIDAAFGTGFRGSWRAPAFPAEGERPMVLAVDIPSGVDALVGGLGGLGECLAGVETQGLR